MRGLRRRGRLLAFLATALPLTAPAQAERQHLVQSVDLRVPVAPTPVTIAGSAHLAYELRVTNPRPVEVVLDRVDVLDTGRAATLATFEGPGLAARLGRPGLTAAGAGDKRVIGAGLTAVVYFWLKLEGPTPPTALRHRLALTLRRAGGEERVVVEGGDTPVSAAAPLILAPPLRGGPWVALYDPQLVGGHRTTIYTLDGRARIPGRFAVDWVKLAADGSHARGDGSGVASSYGYGAPVLAVADAVVAAAMDDLPDSAPGPPATPVALENASGNYVSLDLGGGRHAFYEHLRPGSVRVKAGDRVKRGDVLAELGNSGSSSSGPHLHLHVADGASELGAEGVPFVLDGFEVVGAYDGIEAAASGRPWSPPAPGMGGARRRELPAPNVVVQLHP